MTLKANARHCITLETRPPPSPHSPDALQPLRITGMKAYTHEVDQREVILDLNIRFSDLSDFSLLFLLLPLWVLCQLTSDPLQLQGRCGY